MTTTLEQLYTDIAVPVDFSELGWRVLPLAERLARGFEVPISFLHVDTSSPWSDTDAELLRLRATPFGRSIEVQVVPDPDVALGIARTIAGQQALVVMGSHAHTGAAEMFIDSSTEDVVRALDGPLVLGGPRLRDTGAPLKRIVCCLDSGSPPEALLADVGAWARQLQLNVELLTVVPGGTGDARDATRQQEHDVDVLAERLRSGGLDAVAVVLRGSSVGHQIVEYANDIPGTVLALATHARTASVRALIGSVGMKVVRHAYGPVLLRRRDS